MSTMKYGHNPVAEVLHVIACNSGEDACSGNVESPTGWFARLSVMVWELEGIQENYGQDIKDAELDDIALLLGHWLIIEDEQGFVHLEAFINKYDLLLRYNELEAKYDEWDSQDETA